jgi:hypothetical protein
MSSIARQSNAIDYLDLTRSPDGDVIASRGAAKVIVIEASPAVAKPKVDAANSTMGIYGSVSLASLLGM